MRDTRSGSEGFASLPGSAPGWDESDRAYADARRDMRDAVRAWRAAGGLHPVGGQPSLPVEWERIRQAEERRNALARSASLPDPKDVLSGIKAASLGDVEAAIAWLESDPFAWGTGFMKQKIMSALCRAPLSPLQEERLRELLVQLTTRGPRQEFREACRLARRVDGTEFRYRLRTLTTRPELHISGAASRMLGACESNGRHGGAG